jgi:hypothetical protein
VRCTGKIPFFLPECLLVLFRKVSTYNLWSCLNKLMVTRDS